jgi:hypothetical protein
MPFNDLTGLKPLMLRFLEKMRVIVRNICLNLHVRREVPDPYQ